MSISGIKSGISALSNSCVNRMTSLLPYVTVDSKKVIKGIKWVGTHISSPENRLILGASALLSQPFIDLYNPRVDDETRKTSAARTVAKIIAGTTSGYLVRYYSIKAIEKMTRLPSKINSQKWWRTFFTPDPKRVKLTAKTLNNYKKSIGTILALVVMVGTNFLFDAPVTKFLTNKFISLIKRKDTKNNTKIHLEEQKNQYLADINSTHKSTTNLIDMAKRKYLSRNKGRLVNND